MVTYSQGLPRANTHQSRGQISGSGSALLCPRMGSRPQSKASITCLQHKDLGWRTLEPPAPFCNEGGCGRAQSHAPKASLVPWSQSTSTHKSGFSLGKGQRGPGCSRMEAGFRFRHPLLTPARCFTPPLSSPPEVAKELSHPWSSTSGSSGSCPLWLLQAGCSLSALIPLPQSCSRTPLEKSTRSRLGDWKFRESRKLCEGNRRCGC